MFNLCKKAYHAISLFVKGNPSRKGVAFALIAAFFYSTMALIAKFASTSMSSEMMVWARQTIALLVFLPIFLIDHHRQEVSLFKAARPGLLILRTFASLTAAYCLFYAIAHLPLTNAVLLSYTRPLFIPILVWIIQRKRIEKSIWIGLIVGFLGIILVIKPTAALESASIAGLAAGLAGALATLCIRWLAKTQPPNQITFYYFLFSACLASFPLIWLWEMPNLITILWLILIGALSTVYQMCVTRAYRHGRATIISSVLYSVLIFSALYEWFFWNKIPDLLTWFGILLICASSIFTVTRANKTRKTTMAAPK